jgi:hypothetical protein
VITLPLQPGLLHYTVRVEFDTKEFLFEFRWNARASAWSMTITDAAGNVLLAGRRVVLGFPLLSRFRDLRLPAGELLAVDTAGTEEEANMDDLGTRISLVYMSAAELLAAGLASRA